MTTYHMPQGSLEWLDIRRKFPTASRMSEIMTPSKRQYSSQAAAYIAELVSESKKAEYYPDPKKIYRNAAMDNGIRLEPEARAWYSFANGVDVEEVGFVVSDCGRFGCSPDGLVPPQSFLNEDDGIGMCYRPHGGVEIKCPELKRHCETLDKGVLPLDHWCQIHGCMIVCNRRWWNFVSYHPDEEPFQIRVEWSEFTDTLARFVNHFCDRLDEAKRK